MPLHYTPTTPSISDLTLHLDLPDLPQTEEMELRDTFFPAEWHPQSGVQLTWPHAATDWASLLPEVDDCFVRIAYEILNHDERLLIVTPEADRIRALLAERLPARLLPAVCYFECPTNDTWARDHGFITVEDTSDIRHQTSDIKLLDFQFNGWGEKFEAKLDNAINKHLYDQGLVKGTYEDHLDFVLEGGSIESDGKGTIFTTTCCLMAPHRNQPLTQTQIEERLKAYLGAERVVWLNHGSLIGDDTDGHIDTLARICPNDTIVYTGGDADHPDLALMEEELKALRTLEGKPYRLLKLPLPRPIYETSPDLPQGEEKRLPATYANYLVINGAVLVPTYAQPDLDTEALRIIGEAFPDREIVGIDCRAVIKQHGSLHCCTMQYY